MSEIPRWLALGAALVACDPSPRECGDGVREVGSLCFPAPAIERVGQGFEPGAMAALDLDGDGALDLAAANPARQTISITWGGPRPFARMTSWSVGRPLVGLAHGDFDGDGHLDLAAALPHDDAVATLYGRGGRRFELALAAAGSSPRAVLGADLDADGRSELLTANLGDGSVSVLRRGLADPPVTVGPGPHALAAGDLDGDGALDVAVALTDVDAVQVLLGAGGTLLPGARHIVGFAPSALVASDLDGDGAIDLASADALGGTITLVLGDGAGGARETRTWPVMAEPSALVLSRGGGLPPVLGVLSEKTSELLRLDPRSGEVTSGGTSSWARALTAGDFDRDGREELVFAGDDSEAGALRLGQGPRFTPEWEAPPIGAHAAVDLDGDGRDELVVVPDVAVNALAVWRGPEDVAGLERLATGLEGLIIGIVGADLDADGRNDLVVWGPNAAWSGNTLAVLVQQADGRFHAGGPPLELFAHVTQLRAGDVGGDGTIDLVLSMIPAGGLDDRSQIGLWMVPGDGLGGLGEPVQLDPRSPVATTIVELDGDAALDLAVIFPDVPALELHTDLGAGKSPRLVALPDGVVATAAGDLDGDGALDLLLCAPRDVVLLRDIAGAAALSTAAPGTPCRAIDLRDVDGDGDLDALAQQLDTQDLVLGGPTRGLLSVLSNDGAGGFTLAMRQTLPDIGTFASVVGRGAEGIALAVAGRERFEVLRAGLGPALVEQPLAALGGVVRPRFCDLDGDGLSDWVGGRDQALVAGFGAGAGTFDPAHHAAITGLVDPDVTALLDLATADLDGDGADEVIVLGEIDHPSLPLRALSRLRAAPDGDFIGEPIARLTSEGDLLIVRDLDGDARPDIMVVGSTEDRLELARLRGRGDGSFEPVFVTHPFPPGATYSGLAELDGDERLDLLLQTPGGLAIARGQTGGFDSPRTWWPGVPLGPRVHDLTGDHRPDLLLLTERALLLLPASATGLGAPRVIMNRLDHASLDIADLDGDGGEELLVTTVPASGSARLRIGRPVGDGRFVFRERTITAPGPADGAGVIVEARDLDGDGAPEVVLLDAGGFSIVRQLP